MKLNISTKRGQIDKSNATVVAVSAIATALTIFALVGSKALLDQRSFQSKVISRKSTALTQLKTNVEETNSLVISYREFVARPQNVIGGASNGTGERDGDNARIVLDALPSKYDFPAVITSVEKVLGDLNLGVESISGIDDELGQQGQEELVDPVPVAIPFNFEVVGNYDSMQRLIDSLHKSIRPIQITEMTLTKRTDTLSLELGANTHYQPEKIVDIKTEVLR